MLEEEEVIAANKDRHTGCVLTPAASSLFGHAPHLRALAIACLLQALQQLCGFNSVMYFSATIFETLQFSSPTLVSMSIAITNFLGTVAAFNLIDRVGRRRILLVTIPFMVAALLLCAGAFTLVPPAGNRKNQQSPPPNPRAPAMGVLVSLILYVLSYAVGLGSVPWQQSELFPLSVRSLGSSISTATNWSCNFMIGLTFLPMMELQSPTWTFICYAAICAMGLGLVWAIYPETKGLDLEDVGALLKDGWGVKESLQRVGNQQPDSND